MAELAPLVYGKVVGRYLANIADGPDINDTPEFQPLAGTITFIAEAEKVLVATAVPPATYVQLPAHYEVSLDEFGYITWRGMRGVRLVAPNEDTNPTAWTWRAVFNLTYDGDPVAMSSFNFEVPEFIPGPDEEDPDTGSEGLVDLTLASPVPASNGEAVVRGLSVVDVDRVGATIVFRLDNGDDLPPVPMPEITDVIDAKDDAEQAKDDAVQAKNDAQNIVDSFDLVVGTITTGAPGDPASLSVTGGPPVYTLSGVLPKGDTGATGAPGSSAWGSITGKPSTFPPTIGAGAGDAVAGNDARLTDARTPTTHTHTASQISDASTIGKSVLTAADAAAVRSAISAVSSADSRLTDTRTPTALTSPYDLSIVVCGKDTTRASSSAGDFPFGIKLQRNIEIDAFTIRATTADASGNLVVELRKNGSAVSGTSLSVAFGSQVAGGSNTGGPWAFSAGEILLPYITGVGGTPGKGLIVDIKGRA